MKPTQPQTLAEAVRKARYGHRDWIFWTDKAGTDHFESKSRDSIKKALLSAGTQGRWYIIDANSGVLFKGWWWLGINMMRQIKGGY